MSRAGTTRHHGLADYATLAARFGMVLANAWRSWLRA
jgi:hypothetical protein